MQVALSLQIPVQKISGAKTRKAYSRSAVPMDGLYIRQHAQRGDDARGQREPFAFLVL